MSHITSTMTAPVQYNIYTKSPGGANLVKESVTIQGGANVANKHFMTPEGAVTEVTDAQIELLKQNAVFKLHLEGGFVKIHQRAKLNTKDMEEADKSSPITPKKLRKANKKVPKTTKE